MDIFTYTDTVQVCGKEHARSARVNLTEEVNIKKGSHGAQAEPKEIENLRTSKLRINNLDCLQVSWTWRQLPSIFLKTFLLLKYKCYSALRND
jgi:hypothetical protein